MPGRLRASPRSRVVLAENVQQIGVFQFDRAVGFTPFVHQQRKVNVHLLLERLRIDLVAQSHRGNGRAALTKPGFVRAQLRDVLAAENSAVVAEKGNHRRLAQPKRTEAQFAAIGVRQGDHSQPPV